MITTYLLLGIGTFLSAIMSLFLPIVTIATIPFVGSYVYSALVYAIGIWNAFMVTFPYAQLPWHLFLVVILPFEIIMLILKLILGSRVPSHHNLN